MNFRGYFEGLLLRQIGDSPVVRRKEWPQRAALAVSFALPAVVLSHSNDEPVHLVVDLHQRRTPSRAHRRRRMSSAAESRFQLRRWHLLLIESDRRQGSLE